MAFCALISASQGQVILRPASAGAQPFRIAIAPSSQPTVVEATTDLVHWVAIATNAANGSSVTVTDPQAASFARRFYRVRTVTPPLQDLGQLTNQVFVSGDGFNTLQFAPNGKLGLIVWRGQDLVYRERVGTAWSEQILGRFGNVYTPGTREEYRFQPHAALLFDSQSRARVVRLSGSTVRHHLQQANGTFVEDPAIPVSPASSSYSLFTAAIGPNDTLHIAVVGSQNNAPISYGSNRNGAWQWSVITNVTGDPRGFFKQSWAPRWFSMAIDAQNSAHLTFCPQFAMPLGPEGYVKPNNELHYASNRGGAWTLQRIAYVPDASGDAGQGASIAIGPNNEPAIAAWYNERWRTGSSDFCQLHYYARDASGAWSKQLVAANAAGYLAGDGDKGTGFAPYLRFDARGRPNIAFLDDAAQHFPLQNEYAGNLRHAYFDGSGWVTRTIYSQSAALDRQIVYPAMATFESEVVFMGLDRRTVWQNDRAATSTYTLFLIETTLASRASHF